MTGSTGSARQEAERLVATILAMAQTAKDDDLSRTRGKVTDGLSALGDTVTGLLNQFTGPSSPESSPAAPGASGNKEQLHGWATGSAECCVCPVCKAIAAVRNPSPTDALRLATGAGDVATGMASILRGLSSMASSTARPKPPTPAPPTFTPDVTWSAATRTTTDQPAPAETDPATNDPWTAATRNAPPAAPTPPVRKAAPKKAAAKPSARGTDPWAAATAEVEDGPGEAGESGPSPDATDGGERSSSV